MRLSIINADFFGHQVFQENFEFIACNKDVFIKNYIGFNYRALLLLKHAFLVCT